MDDSLKEVKVLDNLFNKNIKYLLVTLENDIKNYLPDIEDKLYLELSKTKITNYFNQVFDTIKTWNILYSQNEISKIIENYKEIEGIVSELELCLVEHDNDLHINGIAYSISEIGEILKEKKGKR